MFLCRHEDVSRSQIEVGTRLLTSYVLLCHAFEISRILQFGLRTIGSPFGFLLGPSSLSPDDIY